MARKNTKVQPQAPAQAPAQPGQPAQGAVATAEAKPEVQLPVPVLPAERAHPVVGNVLANVDAGHVIEVADGLPMVRPNEANLVIPALAKYPLGVTKSGRMSGKLLNIADFCRLRTGRAFNDRHAKRVEEEEHIKLQVVSDDVKKTLSEELDKLRGQYHQDVKASVAAIYSRKDVEVQKVRVRPTAKGVAFDSTAVLNLSAPTVEQQLRAQLEAQAKEIAKLKEALPKNVKAKIEKEESKAIEVQSTVEPAIGAAPAVPVVKAEIEGQPPVSTPAAPVTQGEQKQ